jgi:hypothetical protein
MGRFRLTEVPCEVIQADTRRFDEWTTDTVIQYTGLAVDRKVISGYFNWFVGRDYGWKGSWGEEWFEGGGRRWAGGLGHHLSGKPVDRLLPFDLHMHCKAGSRGGKPFYWTRFLGIDIDHRPGEKAGGVRERYDRCLHAIGSEPIVLRSPRHGLHLFFPLTKPVSVLGFIQSFRPDLPLLIPAVLEAEGLTVRPGSIELLPTSSHTLRLPLAWATTQLDPRTLMPLPIVPRAEEIARLVATMDANAALAPLDPFALAEQCAGIRPSRPSKVAARGLGASAPTHVTASVAPAGPICQIDVVRLEVEGLYEGVTRNAAAMALASRKMLALGWAEGSVVEFLVHWTATMTNGRSTTASKLPCAATEAILRKEYIRICQGIQRGLAEGRVVARIGGGIGHPITDAEARWAYRWTDSIIQPHERYRIEVFLFCVLGFAKDRGQVATGPSRYAGASLIHAQLSSKMMERWPFGGSGGYLRWLTWAKDSGFTRLVLNYRHSQDPALSRARTFELEVEMDSAPGIGVNPSALLEAAQKSQGAGAPRVHPRQIEHALFAIREYGDGVFERYGQRDGQLVRRLISSYETALMALVSGHAVPDAA